MAKRKTIAALYKDYFYENGEILKGGAFILAYKHFILDAYNGEIIITVDGDDIVPRKEKTPGNLQNFQERFDRYLSDHVYSLSGKEKKDAFETPVFACFALYEDKLKCSKLNFSEISDAVSASMSTYNKLLVRMASAFASNEPEKSKEGKQACADELVSIAKDIKSHKPGWFSYIFSRSTYNKKMAEYNDLKEKLESSIALTFYPSEIKDKNILNKSAFSFLNLDTPMARQNNSDTNRYDYRDMISQAKTIIDADFTSVYYKKDVDDYMEEKKAQIEHNYAILSDEPVSEEIQNSNLQNEEIKEKNKVQIEVIDNSKEEINPDMVPVQNTNQEPSMENVKNN